MTARNLDTKQYAKANGVYLWEIAEVMGTNDSNFSKYLRKELNQSQKEQVMRIIDQIKEGR